MIKKNEIVYILYIYICWIKMYSYVKCVGVFFGRGSGGYGLKIIYVYIEVFFVNFGIFCVVIFI